MWRECATTVSNSRIKSQETLSSQTPVLPRLPGVQLREDGEDKVVTAASHLFPTRTSHCLQ